MKKAVILLLIVVCAMFIFLNRGYYKNTYSGKYEYKGGNVVIILSADNSCTLVDTLYRDTVYIKGKYSIEDNNIKLILNEGNPGAYKKIYFDGRVKGHSIELYNFYNDDNAIFHLKDRFSLLK